MRKRRSLESAFRPRILPGPRGRRLWWWSSGMALLALVVIWLVVPQGKEKEVFLEYTVEKGNLEVTTVAAGDVSPQNRVELKPPRAGRIDEILVDEGDRIRKGQVLAWVSSTDRAALLDAARAKGPEEVAKWEEVYRPTPLVAPMSGFVIARFSEPGQTVTGGSVPLVMADRLIVRAQVDETDMAKIAVGQKAKVTLDAYPGLRIPGRVDHLAFEARTVNNITVYDLEIELRREPKFLRSGMTATAVIVVAERRRVVLAPAEAFKETEEGLKIRVKRDAEKSRWVPVSTGVTDGAMVEVTKGIKEGDVLLISTSAIPPSTISASDSPFLPKRWRPSRGAPRAGRSTRR